MADATGLLLAAGLSNRFGKADKLLAELDGRPLAVHAAASLAAAGVADLIAVCASTALARRLRPLGYRIIPNERPEAGLGHSLALGAMVAPPSRPLLVALADMPRVSRGHLRQLLTAPGRIAASVLDGIPMPPARFDPDCLPTLRQLAGDRGARTLLATATLVEAPAGELVDVDTPDELNRLRGAPSGS